jgi:hypothetical protein
MKSGWEPAIGFKRRIDSPLLWHRVQLTRSVFPGERGITRGFLTPVMGGPGVAARSAFFCVPAEPGRLPARCCPVG